MSTGIEWTDETWNPTTGCDRVSPGCDNCYALTMAKRLKGMGSADYQTDGDPKTSGPGFGLAVHPHRLDLPLSWKKPRKVFVNSMSDLFHDGVSDEHIARVWQAMGAAPQHTYQILTKRHARMRSWVTRWYAGEIDEPLDVRPVDGFPGYFVTTHGTVTGKRSDTRGGLAQEAGEQGHRRVTMHREGSPRSGERALVHRLVLSTFVRKPRAGEQACHRNGNPGDNRLSNLYWGTQSSNWEDRLRHGNGRSWSKLSESDVAAIRLRSSAGEPTSAIAEDYPVSDVQIGNIVSGRQWSNPTPETPITAPGRAVLQSVWLGVSVENQQWADIRIPALLMTPAAVRFLSCEPLLGPVDLTAVSYTAGGGTHLDVVNGHHGVPGLWRADAKRIDWVIVGGESGHNARPMHPQWARTLANQCDAAGIPFHFKQWGEWATLKQVPYSTNIHQHHTKAVVAGKTVYRVGKKAAGRELDGRTWDQYPAVAS